jgi:two-component system, LytTR family, sensor kinase
VDGQQQGWRLCKPADHVGEVSARGRVLFQTFWTAGSAILFWTALGVFFASQLRLTGLPWGVALAYSMPRWYTWGLLTPAIVRVDRGLGTNRSQAARVAWHIPIGIGFTCLSIAIRLATRPLRGASPIGSLTDYFFERFYWDLLIYAVIAGIAISRDYAAQVRQRERQAAELAIKTAELQRLLAESRLQSLRAQIHPHFLFNALNTISAFTETDPRTARQLMERLADLLRASLRLGSRPMVTLADELTFLDDYLAIESARFEGRVTVSVNADDNAFNVMVPSFLLQPLVENAIRHGVVPRVSGGHVEVAAVRHESTLHLQIRDNGVGLCAGWDFERNAGIGLRNVASRLEHLYGVAGLLRLTPIQSGGVEVRLDLPLTPMPDGRATLLRRLEGDESI